MFTPDVNIARQLLYETWHKFQAGQPVEGIEQLILTAIQAHPESHTLLNTMSNGERLFDMDNNPFLRIWLHVSLLEQLSINQPTGIRELYHQVQSQYGAGKATEDIFLDALEQVIEKAQQHHRSPDPTDYFQLIQQRSGLHLMMD